MTFSNLLYQANDSGWLSVFGLALTVGGFILTIYGVFRSKNAAESAEASAKTAVAEITKLKTVTDLSTAISELEGVRRLLREDSITQLPERLALVRKLLIGIGRRYNDMAVENAEKIRCSIEAFANIEKDIDRHHRGKITLRPDKINASLIDEVDRLIEVLSSLA